MMTFEKLSDYKRSLKTFIRGMIKAKVMTAENGQLNVTLSREITEDKTKQVIVTIDNGEYVATFTAEVATRIYNKFDANLFAPIEKQFNKLKNFGGIVLYTE